MTVAFSAVLNNVTAMIIVGSLTAVSLEKLDRRDKLLGFLLVEGLLTNIGGLHTLISSVPNIIVGAAAGISFMAFFIKASSCESTMSNRPVMLNLKRNLLNIFLMEMLDLELSYFKILMMKSRAIRMVIY